MSKLLTGIRYEILYVEKIEKWVTANERGGENKVTPAPYW